MSRPFKACLIPLLLATTLLAGCSLVSFTPQLRGNRVDPQALKELVPGTSTRADVTSLVGSPTSKAAFDDNTWYYISEYTQPRIGRVLGVNDQQVVVMTFNQQGTLQKISTLDQDDSKPVDVVSRTTPSPGSDATFLQQLLGNVGKFNATPSPGTQGTGQAAGNSGASFGNVGK